MEKKLSEMNLEELWQLFPIVLAEHRACWSEWYTEEEAFLKNNLPQIERISHIGSTAIGSIRAKPIIDILVEVSKNHRLADYKDLIVESGYICMSETASRISFNKGYTEKGFAEKVIAEKEISMNTEKLLRGESKNIEYKSVLPEQSEKIHQEHYRFCQYPRRQNSDWG